MYLMNIVIHINTYSNTYIYIYIYICIYIYVYIYTVYNINTIAVYIHIQKYIQRNQNKACWSQPKHVYWP